MDCSSCGRYVGELGDQKASIAVLKGGDEHIYSYFSCDECGAYTVEVYHDFFITGESTILLLPPLSNEEGNGILELIGRCPDRDDKSCDCEAHKFHE